MVNKKIGELYFNTVVIDELLHFIEMGYIQLYRI